MPPKLALFVCLLFVMFVFWSDRKRNVQVSWALFYSLLWYVVVASRPIGAWLSIWGVSLPISVDPTEGSVVDKWFYGIIALIGIFILSRRQINWASIIRENAWLIMLFSFIAISILWSDYPLVSFKRIVKLIGATIMALVVLTELNPLEAIAAILRRCAYIVIPFSIVTIRYFRDIGIDWDWSGDAVSWVGIATSKNVLGQVAVTGALCFIWERIRRRDSKEGKMIDYLYIMMSLYLLKGSDDALSMTSISVFAVGLFVFLMLSSMKSRMERVKPFFVLSCVFIFGILLMFILHTLNPFSKNSLMGVIIGTMGRDMTLTGRTEIWSDIFKIASRNPMLGVGYGSFWIGRLANIPWAENMRWILGQGHNGYVDAYLQLGWVGIILLMAVILSIGSKIIRSFSIDFEYGRFRITFFLIILFVNITESTFLKGDHNMLFLFLLAAFAVPYSDDKIATKEDKDGPLPLVNMCINTVCR